MSRFQNEEIAIERAKEFMIKNPTAPRSRVAKYAGAAESVLEKWGVELPKPVTNKQRTPWRIGHMI